jgi:glutamate-1-semialdehyde 2,1-aminomutase
MNVERPVPGFLEGVKRLAAQHGAVLIFDETITGFRFANGGAQEHFGVTPDLACFGKGLANGYPVSAVAGNRDIMLLMEEIFFSFTFGGEMLSLAAAKAVLQKLAAEPVVSQICENGQRIIDGVDCILRDNQLGDIFSIKGHPSWSFLTIADARGVSSFELKTLLMQELHQRGFLSVGTHNVNYAHTQEDIESLLAAYRELLPMIGEAANRGEVLNMLRCDPLVPLFKVR